MSDEGGDEWSSVDAQHTSSIDIWLAEAALVTALLTKWAVIPARIPFFLVKYNLLKRKFWEQQ